MVSVLRWDCEGRAPDEAAVAVLVGEKRGGPTDHRGGGERAEVAAVEAVGGFEVHEEEFAVGDHPAASPDRQVAATAVAIAGLAERNVVDRDGAAVAANALTRQTDDVLEDRDVAADITAFDHEGRERLGRHNGDEIRHFDPPGRRYRVEADRRARRGVPDQPQRHWRGAGDGYAEHGDGCRREVAEPCHRPISRRRSHAL